MNFFCVCQLDSFFLVFYYFICIFFFGIFFFSFGCFLFRIRLPTKEGLVMLIKVRG